MARVARKRKLDSPALDPLAALLSEYVTALRVKDYSESTIRNRQMYIRFFLQWCAERSLGEPAEITRPVLERYQRHLFHHRKKDGDPLSFRSQHARLVALRTWFRWMTRQNHILHNSMKSSARKTRHSRKSWSISRGTKYEKQWRSSTHKAGCMKLLIAMNG